MNTKDYMLELEEELRELPKKKRELILKIYQDKINVEIDLGTDEENIIKSLPTPSEVAIDLYEKEGIDYKKKRNRRTKNKAIKNVIISIFLLILLISGSLVLTTLFGYLSFKQIKLLTLMINVKEFILMLLLIIPLIVLFLTIYIYLIDLFVMVFNYLLELIIVSIGKESRIKDFSLTQLIEEKLKVNKLFKKILIASSILTVVFGIVNVVFKTYFYRSFTKIDPTNYSVEVDLSTYTFDNLVVDIDEAKINYVKGDSFKVELSSEFKRKVNVELNESDLVITSESIQTFDLFNFLKEPLPVFTVYIPTNVSNETIINNGYISYNDLTLNEVINTLNLGNTSFEKCNVDKLNISFNNAGASITNSTIIDLSYKTYNGSSKINNVNITSLDINNNLASFEIVDSKVDNVLLKTNGTMTLTNINSNKIEADVSSNEFEINRGNVNYCNITSKYSSNVTIGNITTNKVSVTTIGGDIVCANIQGDLELSTGSNATVKGIEGNLKLKALGSWISVQEVRGSSVIIETETIEASVKFIASSNFTYNGVRSKSTLYFVFSTNITMIDAKGELHFDNDKSILSSDSDITLYDKYYQQVENLIISSNATYRLSSDAKVTIQ